MFYPLFYRDISDRTRAVRSLEGECGEPGESSVTSRSAATSWYTRR